MEKVEKGRFSTPETIVRNKKGYVNPKEVIIKSNIIRKRPLLERRLF